MKSCNSKFTLFKKLPELRYSRKNGTFDFDPFDRVLSPSKVKVLFLRANSDRKPFKVIQYQVRNCRNMRHMKGCPHK